MEGMEVSPDHWSGKRVLVTGHTGFKGAWLSLWLGEMGAKVFGLSLAPTTRPNLYELLQLDGVVTSTIADINDADVVRTILARNEIECVFHLAAQALVRASYDDPVVTFATNTGGVVTLLNEVRRAPSVAAVVVVTSDKVYDNREWPWGYREDDRLGGRDPYSASKSCAELAASSMQRSYFAPFAAHGHPAKIATVRAGNVVGGGDWSPDRLVPDIVKGCLGGAGEVIVRNPNAVRPWQHVLEPLRAYIHVAEKLTQGQNVDEPWNIGPDPADNRSVLDVAQALVANLGAGSIVIDSRARGPHEATVLALDSAKARQRLGWSPRLNFARCMELTSQWYIDWHLGRDVATTTRQQIGDYQTRHSRTLPTRTEFGTHVKS